MRKVRTSLGFVWVAEKGEQNEWGFPLGKEFGFRLGKMNKFG